MCCTTRVGDGTAAPSIQVFLDSPMAISATEIFQRHPESCRTEVAALLRGGRDPLRPAGPASHPRSRRVDGDQQDRRRRRHHGRIRHGDRRARAPPPEAQPLAARSRHRLRRLRRARARSARSIIDGAQTLRLFGEEIPVRAPSTRSTASPPTPTSRNCWPGAAPWAAAPRPSWCTAKPTRWPASPPFCRRAASRCRGCTSRSRYRRGASRRVSREQRVRQRHRPPGGGPDQRAAHRLGRGRPGASTAR